MKKLIILSLSLLSIFNLYSMPTKKICTPLKKATYATLGSGTGLFGLLTAYLGTKCFSLAYEPAPNNLSSEANAGVYLMFKGGVILLGSGLYATSGVSFLASFLSFKNAINKS